MAIPSRSKNRAAQAGRTQARRATIISTAGRLFVAHGYLQTTMAEIAKEAGVAVQTLYLSYRSKVDLLRTALDVTLAGDDDPLPILERPWFARLKQEPRAAAALDIFIELAVDIIPRVYPLYATVVAASADPEVADVLTHNKQLRAASFTLVIREVAGKKGFNNQLTVEKAAQILYTLLSEETYGLLVVEQGWPVNDWRDWVRRHMATDIFA